MEEVEFDTPVPAWAYKVAYERSFGSTRHSADDLKQTYSNSVSTEGMAIRAFAACIAKHETEPVDPDEQAVADILTTYVGHAEHRDLQFWKRREAGFYNAVATYRQWKESSQ